MTWRASFPVPDFLPGRKDALVPTRPVMPGFLLDTLFYVLPVLLLCRAAAALRARRRRGPVHAPAAGAVTFAPWLRPGHSHFGGRGADEGVPAPQAGPGAATPA